MHSFFIHSLTKGLGNMLGTWNIIKGKTQCLPQEWHHQVERQPGSASALYLTEAHCVLGTVLRALAPRGSYHYYPR